MCVCECDGKAVPSRSMKAHEGQKQYGCPLCNTVWA